MIEELIVVEQARREAQREAPDEPIAAGRGRVTRALRALDGGASVPEPSPKPATLLAVAPWAPTSDLLQPELAATQASDRS